MAKIRRAEVQSVEDVVTIALRDAILSGQLPPGEKLPQERLAGELRVSRIPLRDALRRLEGEGLVRIDPRRGAEVASLSPKDVREIYELRMGIEPGLMQRAVAALDATAADRLLRMSEHMDDLASDPTRGSQARREFYSELYAYADRPRTRRLALALRDDVQRYHVLAAVPSSLLDHATLRQCISRRDPKAAAEVHAKHLGRSSADLVSALERRLS